MAWRDTLINLRDELAEARLRRLLQIREEDARIEQSRVELREQAASLGIAQLLADINVILLAEGGTLETFVSWEEASDEYQDLGLNLLNQDDDGDDEAEEICFALSWEEDGDRAIEIELGLTEGALYLMVNGVETRPERDALELAVVEAFREELEL